MTTCGHCEKNGRRSYLKAIRYPEPRGKSQQPVLACWLCDLINEWPSAR